MEGAVTIYVGDLFQNTTTYHGEECASVSDRIVTSNGSDSHVTVWNGRLGASIKCKDVNLGRKISAMISTQTWTLVFSCKWTGFGKNLCAAPHHNFDEFGRGQTLMSWLFFSAIDTYNFVNLTNDTSFKNRANWAPLAWSRGSTISILDSAIFWGHYSWTGVHHRYFLWTINLWMINQFLIMRPVSPCDKRNWWMSCEKELLNALPSAAKMVVRFCLEGTHLRRMLCPIYQ